jgi:hypothetical protein
MFNACDIRCYFLYLGDACKVVVIVIGVTSHLVGCISTIVSVNS